MLHSIHITGLFEALRPQALGRALRDYRARQAIAQAKALNRQRAAWTRDPLSHPDIQRMTRRELDDLPFDPARAEDM